MDWDCTPPGKQQQLARDYHGDTRTGRKPRDFRGAGARRRKTPFLDARNTRKFDCWCCRQAQAAKIINLCVPGCVRALALATQSRGLAVLRYIRYVGSSARSAVLSLLTFASSTLATWSRRTVLRVSSWPMLSPALISSIPQTRCSTRNASANAWRAQKHPGRGRDQRPSSLEGEGEISLLVSGSRVGHSSQNERSG